MTARGLFIATMLLALAGLAWHQQDALRAWAGKAAAVTQASVGGPDAGAAPAPRASGPFKAGELRKCVLGQQVTYANTDCPKGATAQPVTAGTVTVVPGTPVAKPAAAGSGPSALHKALDITRDDTLRDKIMERQMEGAR